MATKKIKTVVKGPYNPASLTIGNDYLDQRDEDKIQKALDNPEAVELLDELTRTVQARAITQPEVRSASVIQKFDPTLDINVVAQEMRDQSAEIRKGNMGRAEEMLIAQAHSLDALFANLARKAHGNMEAGYLQATETYMRLALKAQAQAVRTIEALAELKNPRQVAFVKQANIANMQQVNNGASSQAGNFENQQSKLSAGETAYGLHQDTRAPSLESATYSPVEALETIDRAKVCRGQSQGISERI